MSRFANWFKKTVDIKLQGPFALLLPTFNGATIEGDQGITTTLSSAAFHSFLENDQPRVMHRQTIRQESSFANALAKTWGQIPHYVLVIPVKHQGSTIVSLLGRRESPKPEHLHEYMTALTERAIEATELPAGGANEIAKCQTVERPTVITTMTGRVLAINEGAQELFGQSQCLHLESLLGPKISHAITEKYEALTLNGQIQLDCRLRDSQHESWMTAKLHLVMNEHTIALQMHDFEPNDQRRQSGITQVGLKGLSLAVRPIPRTRKFRRNAGQILCWLECEPLEPIPLGPQPIVTVGRSDSNDLVLPHKSVSRNHATLKIAGHLVMLEDHGSANGVLVNGERRPRYCLEIGDQISIGPYELFIRAANDKPSNDPCKTTFRTHVSLLDQGAALAGDLRETPLAELLQSLEFNQKTGTLAIFDGKASASIRVQDGRLHSAVYGELQNLEAMLKILELEHGQFTFSKLEPNCERTMNVTVTSVLLEFSRRIDENNEPQSSEVTEDWDS